ncbi:MAG: radical SAM protein, partial [Phycisphaerae bacterium]|nr:radical SAM protein [Phycisphaerae bacterium]
TDIRRRLRAIAPKHDLTTVIAYAFDHRTRMLPFIYADMKMVPAGVRAIGGAMVDSGFAKTRIVLQQWSKNFLPSQMRLDGRIPDIFMVSTMRLHWGPCEEMIRDACRIDPANRPLIIVGGPKTIYEPWDVFSTDPADPWGADVAVTGEEYVLLSMMEVLLSERIGSESLRATFLRARDSGALDGIPGLVYAQGRQDNVAEELVDTGIQRLLGDLDELSDSTIGYSLLERPSTRTALASRAIPARHVHRYSQIGGLILTLGCKFACPYCPIPAYNQRQLRYKTGRRIAEEMAMLYRKYGMRYFFGADDNFFNNKDRTIKLIEDMAATDVDGKSFSKIFRWGTEVTVHDTLQMKDHLRTVRKAGIRALWLGVEDMTGALVKKGLNVNKTLEAFRLLQERGIAPMPMMMHHDSQPLYTPGKPNGLLNQVRMLRKAGAMSLQVLMISPATGSKIYAETYSQGLVYRSAGRKQIEPYMIDGNYVIASKHSQPWRKQFNIMIAYLYFYNPLRFLIALLRPKSSLYLADSGMQIIGMYGLALTIRRTLRWAFRLMHGEIKRHTSVPASPVPMRSVDGGPASHALPGTPTRES